MRAGTLVVVGISTSVLVIAGVLLWGLLQDVEALRSDLVTLRNEACVELVWVGVNRDILEIEVKALHGVPLSENVSELPYQDDDSNPYNVAIMEALGRFYTTPPRGGGAGFLTANC